MTVVKPDYLSRDYTSLRRTLLQHAQQVMPEWHPASEGDFGTVMVELLAYMGDILSYYTDRAQFENYLPTATQRDSILNLAFMLGYIPNSGSPASGSVTLTTDKGASAITVPAGTQITTNRVEAIDGPVVFETAVDVVLPANPTGTADPVSVAVVEGATETFQYLGESNGLPGQVFLLPDAGVYQDTIQVFVEDGKGATKINSGTLSEVVTREWVRVDRLLEGDENDRIFETRFSATSSHVLFGDDINGAVPATGLKVYATYRHGNGEAGNVGPGVVRLINTKGQQSLGPVKVAQDSQKAFLSTEMTGGADPESDDSIRVNAPRVYRTQNRVVTERDFEEVALGTQGVSSASAVVGTFTSVTLFIAGPNGSAPSDSLKQAVLDRLEGKTLAGVTVTINSPEFVNVNFGTSASPIRLSVRRGYSLKNVETAAKREIRALVGRLEFGDPLSVNKVYHVLDDIDGVVNVDIDVMARSDATQSGTARITPKAWEMFKAGSIYLNVIRYVKPKNGSD